VKITANQYAKALYELTTGKSQTEVSAVIDEFEKLLAKKNQTKLLSKIIEKFKNIWNKENRIVEAEIISREELSEDLHNKLRNYISNKYKAKEVLINNVVNESIKGGIIIRVGDEVMDGSINKQLKNLKNILNKL
jgi:F-type H+-transporting ATPase subunit delta